MISRLVSVMLFSLCIAAFAAADIPPNTERAQPDRPKSGASADTLIAARAVELPDAPPAATLQLLDSAQQANFDSGSDALTPAARERLDAFLASVRGARVTRIRVTAHTDSLRLIRAAKRRF